MTAAEHIAATEAELERLTIGNQQPQQPDLLDQVVAGAVGFARDLILKRVEKASIGELSDEKKREGMVKACFAIANMWAGKAYQVMGPPPEDEPDENA
jgi:hypothetical protein